MPRTNRKTNNVSLSVILHAVEQATQDFRNGCVITRKNELEVLFETDLEVKVYKDTIRLITKHYG